MQHIRGFSKDVLYKSTFYITLHYITKYFERAAIIRKWHFQGSWITIQRFYKVGQLSKTWMHNTGFKNFPELWIGPVYKFSVKVVAH